MKYLKCKYGKGAFSNERLITFDTLKNSERWMFVREEDVIPITENIGLVKLVNIEKVKDAKDGYLVRIINIGDNEISRRYVPKESILVL